MNTSIATVAVRRQGADHSAGRGPRRAWELQVRDSSNFANQWRLVRADLGETLEKVTGHSFRKTLPSIVTADTADPTVAADLLGHSDSSTTLRHYVSRNRLHPEAAELVNRAVTGIAKSGE